MNCFEKYSSNSVASGANQCFFEMKEGEVRTGLAFFKIFAGGRFNYSLPFSGIIDSTFADGKKSYANLMLPEWNIHSLKVGRCKLFPSGELCEIKIENLKTEDFVQLTFNGKKDCKPDKGEICYTDEKELFFESGDYMAIEITYSGKRVPYHPESLLPLYDKTALGYKYSVNMPLPLMIGCDREVKGRICYLGDSITQGIGAGFNTYEHWCARLADMIGRDYSHYNIGIGYARASDAASGGAWLKRAMSCDTVFVCLGTNDIGADEDENTIIRSINTIICKLKSSNCRIILQTAPPFDRTGKRKEVWDVINKRIKGELSERVELIFDTVPLLAFSEGEPSMAKYGGHPNSEGCRVWAEALYKSICEKNIF